MNERNKQKYKRSIKKGDRIPFLLSDFVSRINPAVEKFGLNYQLYESDIVL